MTVRLLKLPAVLGYAAIFWAFDELFLTLVILFGTRVTMHAGIARIALYSLTNGAIGFLLTVALFGALDLLSRRRSGGRISELAALMFLVTATVLVLISTDAVLRAWFDGVPVADEWLDLLQMEFHDTLVIVSFLAGLGNGLRSWAGEAERKLRESELRTAIAHDELEAVAAHLRPAEVSAALREIGLAVEGDPRRARQLILQLATTLRASFTPSR